MPDGWSLRRPLAVATSFCALVVAASTSNATPLQRFIDGTINYRGYDIGTFRYDWHWNDAPGTLNAGIAAPPSLPIPSYEPKPSVAAQFFDNLTLNFVPGLPYGGSDPFCGGANAAVANIGCSYVFGPNSPNPLTAASQTTTSFQVGHNAYGPGADTFDIFSSALVGAQTFPFTMLFSAPVNSGCLSSSDITPILTGNADCVLNNGRLTIGAGQGFLEKETFWANLLGLSSVTYGDYIDYMPVTDVSPIPEPSPLLPLGVALSVMVGLRFTDRHGPGRSQRP